MVLRGGRTLWGNSSSRVMELPCDWEPRESLGCQPILLTDGAFVPMFSFTVRPWANHSTRLSSSVRWETKTICCLCRIQERENWLSFCSSACFMTLKERLQRRPVTFILVMEGTTYICLSSQIGWDNKILLEESSTAMRTIFYVKWQVTLVIGWAEK